MKKENQKEYSRVQKIRNTIWLLFRDLHAYIKYGRTFVFDTNFLIRGLEEPADKRYRKLFFCFSTKLTTETAVEEKDLLLATGNYVDIGYKKIEVLSFEDIRKDIPYLCPLYYNYLSWMHNPASFMSDDFHLHSFLREDIIDGKKIADRNVLSKLINHLNASRDVQTKLLEDNPSFDDEWEVMCRAETGAFKKKRTAIKKSDTHYFNDLKFTSLSLFYVLNKNRNITILTADSDFVNLVLTFWDSFTNECAFKAEILEKISKEGITFSENSTKINLSAASLYKRKEGMLRDAFGDNWKRDYRIFNLKYWDQSKNKYFNFTFRINEEIRTLLLNAWGNYFCPFARSPEMGNWLGMKWYEPNPKDIVNGLNGVEIKVEIWKKYHWPVCSFVGKEIHEEHCLYPKMDKECNYSFFSQFTEERQS